MLKNKLITYLSKSILLKIGAMGGISGCIFVALGMPLYANMVWSVTNPCIAMHNYKIKEHGQMTLWCIYTGLAMFGLIYNWR